MECKRCGNCCWSMPREYWKEKLNEEQINKVLEEKKKFEDNPQHCEAFVFENGLGCCLVQKLFKELEPKECILFSGFQFCDKDGLLPPKSTKIYGGELNG